MDLYTDYLIATDSVAIVTGLSAILDTSLSSDHIITIYQKRWKVEEYHKSLKSNAAIAKSPTKTITTQISHIVMSMIAVFKLECLKIKHSLNHFALKTKKYSSKQNGCNGVN